jgi:hypothetical protein
MRKVFVYFLCVSFLLLTSGFHTMVAEAKEIGRPIGEMISRGEVKFESRENVWKNVESSPFPIFKGVKIKTEKGASLITLEDNQQVEVGENSLFSFDRNDQIHLIQGTLNFRFPSTAELSFKVGDLTVSKYRSLQASQNPSTVSPKSQDTVGSISVHPNGSVTVKSIQGPLLFVVNQDHVVLAALSSKDTVTIPSVTAKSSSKAMVAQAGETTGGTEGGGTEGEKWEFLGISTWGWIGILGGAVVIGVIAGVAAGGGGGGHHEAAPVVCP